MAGQFELAAKHLEVIKKAKIIIEETYTDNSKIFAKELRNKGYGDLPSKAEVYDDYLGLVLSIEEIAKLNPGTAFLLSDQIIAQEICVKYAPNKISEFIDANKLISVLSNETGMDKNGPATTAEKTDKGWKISGVKVITEEQMQSDDYIVIAKEANKKFVAFYITNDQLNPSQIKKEVSGACVVLNQVNIELNVPESQLIAVIPDNMERIISIGKTLVAAVANGISHSTLMSGINMAKQVKDVNNAAISSSQSVQFDLADMYAESEGGRLLAYYSAALIDNNQPSIRQATSAKIQASDAAAEVSMQAMQLLGNYGCISGCEFAGPIRAALTTQSKGGTNRVQRNQLFDYMLAKK